LSERIALKVAVAVGALAALTVLLLIVLGPTPQG
jgi:hypothetical protein